jgi:toxin ParE1/3/4
VAEVQFTNEAVADLGAIDEYSVAQFGEEVGAAYMRGFDKVFALLKDHPKAGAAVPEYGITFHNIVHRRHRIFYVINESVVLIVRILHHSADASRALRE